MHLITVTRFLVSLFLILGPATAIAQQFNLLQPEDAFRLSVQRGAGNETVLQWKIADDYYLYRAHLAASNAKTGEPVDLATDAGTMEEDDPNFGPSEVYYRQAAARLAMDAPSQVAVTYQGCKKDSICYPPMTVTVSTQSLQLSEPVIGFAIPVPDTSASQPEAEGAIRIANDAQAGGLISSLLASGGVFWVILSFLAFGMLLALTPCVLPMYPILSATLAREGETLTARRGFTLSVVYVLAMASAFGVLGIAAAWSGQNLQIILQSPYAIGGVALLFVVLATSMFGLFELQLPSAWVNRVAGRGRGSRGSLGGAATMGFISALIVGPCVTAPLAAALLYIAHTGDAWLGATALFALGFGQGIPLIAFGTLGSRALPRAGAWMVQVKYLFGFVFLATAIWLVSRLVAPELSLALWAIFLLTAAVFMGVADRLPVEAGAGPRFLKAAGLVLSLGGVLLALGAASGGTDPFRPLASFSIAGAGQASAAKELVFTDAGSTTELERKLRASAGRPTLVYFTADWCVTCGVIERIVLPNPDVVAALDGFQRIKIDLTTLDDARKDLMKDLAVVGPPTMLFFDENANEFGNTRLVGDVTAQTLKGSVERAGK